jgi:undecaprenyl-diphosphatase
MDIFQIFILGLVQGVTEMLPISSSAHLILFPKLLHWQDPGLNVDAFLHLGTLFAILIYFRKDLLCLILDKSQRKLLVAIVVATLPVVIIGFTCKPFFEHSLLLRSTKFIAFTLFIVAILLFIADKVFPQKKGISDISFKDTVLIGLAQCLALFPGVSRSGICSLAGLGLGLTRSAAVRFAFLLGSPAIAGAGLLATKDLFEIYTAPSASFDLMNEGLYFAVGFFTSFLAGLISIDFLIKFLSKNTFTLFVVYRIILGVILLVI